MAFPSRLKLHRKESIDLTAMVICADGSPVEGELVTAEAKFGQKHISISPQSAVTDANGQAIFTINRSEGRQVDSPIQSCRLMAYMMAKVID